jgi:hypothetical protein
LQRDREKAAELSAFRANDGSVIDSKNPPAELRHIPAGETWLLNRLGRQYTRTMSRQVYAFCVGSPRYSYLSPYRLRELAA